MPVLAVDLGTTNLSLALAAGTSPVATGDRTGPDTCTCIVPDAGTLSGTGISAYAGSGSRLGQLVLPNPQSAWGTDVMARLEAAAGSPSDAANLQRAVVDGIGAAATQLCGGVGLAPAEITSVAVVGNTAMLTLLTGRSFAQLLDPSRWMAFVDCEPVQRAVLRRSWGLSTCTTIEVIPSLAGFVGSDLLAGLLCTRLLDAPGPALLTDIGTNSEIALWDGQRVWVTSAAGGPAFEGVGVECGMPALPGAVTTARHDAGGWQVETLGGGEPSGISGCGLVDVIALLLRDGRLSDTGRVRNTGPVQSASGRRIDLPGTELWITARDVDLVMRAKAAIAAGCEVLGRLAGIRADDLVRIDVAGAMGTSLNPVHAMQIGLIPTVEPRRVHACGNTALAGCEQYLLSQEVREMAQEVRSLLRVINLACADGFEESFFAHLPLRPQRPWRPS